MAVFRIVIFCFVCIMFGCISSELRMPSSLSEVYSNSQMKQSLMIAAQNRILFNFPAETLAESEKTEIDNRCRQFQTPFWSSKLSVYLNIFRSRPDLFSKFHVIEIKKGDAASVEIQKDMDQVSVLKIQYVKSESRGKVVQSTHLPCQGNLAEYIGREIVKTEFEFPSASDVQTTLEKSADKKENVARFDFATDFLMYLAERGTLFKFSHELSFEKLPTGQFVMAQLMNSYSEEVRKLGRSTAAKPHVNLWIKKINENSKQAELIQFFSVENDQQLKSGIKVDGEKEISKLNSGSMDLTYLFTSYHVDNDQLSYVSLENLNGCLQKFSFEEGKNYFRSPSSESDKRSYLHPGYSCPN
jgi:hypothetical protein